MRIRRVLTVSITALATLTGLATGAGAASGTHFAAPYTTTYTDSSLDCRPGAICTPRAAADQSGGISTMIDLQRVVADQAAPESGSAFAHQVVDVRAPKGAKRLTATFSWTVRSATTSARADRGFFFASTALYASGICAGCNSTDASEALVSSSSLPASDNTHAVNDVQKRLTVTIDNLPDSGKVRLYSAGSAHADMSASVVCTGLPGCDLLPPTDPYHAGTAHASIDATLTAVDVTFAS